MAEIVEDLAFWPGERLYTQYEEGDMMYFIRAGRVRLEASHFRSESHASQCFSMLFSDVFIKEVR